MVADLRGMEAELQQTRVENEQLATNVKLLSEDLRSLQVYRQRYHELQATAEKRDDVDQNGIGVLFICPVQVHAIIGAVLGVATGLRAIAERGAWTSQGLAGGACAPRVGCQGA
jgi:hypothetical protein